MAKYVVHYDLKDGSKSRGTSPKTVECESERTAIDIVKDQVTKDNPGWSFFLKKVEKK
jgi:hypothetical protein